jgi:branched-chain amino acid transport system ATP-binding protein
MNLLEVEGLRASYGQVQVLEGIDFSVAQGQKVAILGPNGAGKTTILRALSGMVHTDGRVELEGRSVVGKPTAEIARSGVAHVPEGRGTFPTLTVEENLRLGGYVRSDGAEVREDIERCYGWFPRLRERNGQQAGSLSGGEQQMLAVGRGLMLRPRLLMLDEPSLGLAPMLVEGLYDLLAELRDEGMTILLVDQMAALALSVADRAYVLQSGTIRQAGRAAELRADPAVVQAYLGEQERTD